VAFVAFCYVVLVLYGGLTGILRIPDHIAAPAVPIIIVVSSGLANFC